MNIGETIKNLRREQNITQEDLAAALNISAQSVSKWENGLSNPDITFIPLIADFFKVSIETLFFSELNEQNLQYKESRKNTKALLIDDDIDSIIALWEDMYSKYPNDYRILKELIIHLCSKKDITLFNRIFRYAVIILKQNHNKAIENEVLDALKEFMLCRQYSNPTPQKYEKDNSSLLKQSQIDTIFGFSEIVKVKNKRIMLTDDAVLMRTIQKEVLSKAGFEVVCEAADGTAAIEKYSEFQPDIVIMDIKMPKCDGITAAKQILAINPQAIIIICSAMTDSAVISEAKKIGVKAFIAKPFNEKTLIGAIEKCII